MNSEPEHLLQLYEQWADHKHVVVFEVENSVANISCKRACVEISLMQVGTTTLAFGYEATIAAGTLATTAAVFYGTPSQKSARLLFRFSLLFLPVFMLGMLIHRVPNDHSVTFTSLKAKLAEGFSLGSTPDRTHELNGVHWPVREFSVAPGPFLPVPMRTMHPVARTEDERTLTVNPQKSE